MYRRGHFFAIFGSFTAYAANNEGLLFWTATDNVSMTCIKVQETHMSDIQVIVIAELRPFVYY